MGIKEIVYYVLLVAEYLIGIWMLFPEVADLRVSMKERAGLGIVGVLVAGAYAYNGITARISAPMVVLFPCISALLFSIFLKKNFWNVSAWNGLYIGVLSLIKLFVIIIRGLRDKANIIEVNYGTIYISDILLEIGLLVILYIVWQKLIVSGIMIGGICRENRWILIGLYLVIYKMMDYIMMMGVPIMQEQMLVITLGAIVVITLMVVLFLYQMSYYQVKDEKNMLVQKQWLMNENYRVLRDHYETLAKINHDINHERTYLYQCISNGNYEAARSFLENKKKYHSAGKVWTGNKAVDFIIELYKAEMDKKAIVFRLESDYTRLPIPEDEFMILLGLLLENSVEAAEKCEEKKWISLSILHRNNIFQMEVCNASNCMPQIKDGKFCTSKSEKEIHGWGTENVKTIISKYEGTVKYQYTKEFFDVKIVFWNL